MTRKRILEDHVGCYMEGPDDDAWDRFTDRWTGRFMQLDVSGEARLYEFQDPKRRLNGRPVYEWNRVTDPSLLERFCLGYMPPRPDQSTEPQPGPEPCKRCGSSGGDRGDGAALLAANPTLRDPEPRGDTYCAQCAGHPMQYIIDMAWKLAAIPTDALMRELARRFL